jgi:hyperosmotically inducible protein
MKNHKYTGSKLITASLLTFCLSSAPLAVATPEQEGQSKAASLFENGVNHGKLEAALIFNDQISVFDIDTEVNGDTATLSGVVSTAVEKDIAEQVALSVDGISNVENKLTIDSKVEKSKPKKALHSMADQLSDAKITTMIESKMAVNDQLSAWDIDVDTKDRKVSLNGKVESEAVKNLAQLVAENTDGVASVENNLVVN